jgi:hypothetical protein
MRTPARCWPASPRRSRCVGSRRSRTRRWPPTCSHRSEGTIGELAGLLTDAAVAAIESGEEAINQRTLLLAPYAGPSERRRLFERELA